MPGLSVQTRTRSTTVALTEPCCLRCSKSLVSRLVSCKKPAFGTCGRCKSIHQSCDEIPSSFNKEVNQLFVFRDQLELDDTNAELDQRAVAAEVKYTKEVKAYLLKKKKSAPKSEMDVQLLLLEELKRNNELLEHASHIPDTASKSPINGSPVKATKKEREAILEIIDNDDEDYQPRTSDEEDSYMGFDD